MKYLTIVSIFTVLISFSTSNLIDQIIKNRIKTFNDIDGVYLFDQFELYASKLSKKTNFKFVEGETILIETYEDHGRGNHYVSN